MRRLKHTAYLFAAFTVWPILALAQNQYDCTVIPFEATYNPIVAYAYDEQCGDSLPALGPIPELRGLPAPPPSFVGTEDSTGTMFVNRMRFHVDDHASALASEAELDKPPQQIPAGFRPLTPEVYKSYLNRIEYRMEHPVRAYIDRIKSHFREKGKEYFRMKKKIEAAVARCFAIAESNYPGNSDAASDYADACADRLLY